MNINVQLNENYGVSGGCLLVCSIHDGIQRTSKWNFLITGIYTVWHCMCNKPGENEVLPLGLVQENNFATFLYTSS